MAKEQDAVARGGDDERAAGQVALGDAAIEGVPVAGRELQDASKVVGLPRVGRMVAGETGLVEHPSILAERLATTGG